MTRPAGANRIRPPPPTPASTAHARAQAWNRLHPRLTRRAAWADRPATCRSIEGTVIRLEVDHLPSGATPKPVWLWWSRTGATAADVDRLWQAFLRRFDIEHTFRLFKQTLGWTRPKIRTPQAADRWTWLIIATHTQLRLARPLAQTYAVPGKTSATRRLTPARVRRGLSTHPRDKRTPRQRAETLPARPRTATRPHEHPPRPTPRRPHRRTTSTKTATKKSKTKKSTTHGHAAQVKDQASPLS